MYEDVIEGKGAGGLYLLYGPPGSGKTLTVEALARYFGKPLYSISFAELGSTTAELEEKLTVTLQLASQWGCLALLDEGNIFIFLILDDIIFLF
jgi:SpoVK/Ycf46/Vps4 family AAA+-type ATPase